jgi:hypothetical protein
MMIIFADSVQLLSIQYLSTKLCNTFNRHVLSLAISTGRNREMTYEEDILARSLYNSQEKQAYQDRAERIAQCKIPVPYTVISALINIAR